MSDADKPHVRMDEELPEGMFVGDPVIDEHSGIQIGTIAGRADVRELDDNHRIVMVRIEQQLDAEGQRTPIQFKVPIKVSRLNAERITRRMKESGATELSLVIPRSGDRLALQGTIEPQEPGTTTVITSEHVSHARELFDRMATAGMLEMPPEVTPGDKVYGDDVVIGRVAMLEEIEKLPHGHSLRYLEVPQKDEYGPYSIPILIDTAAAAPVGKRAEREGRDVSIVVWCSQTDKPLGMPISAARDAAGHRIEATHPGPTRRDLAVERRLHPATLTARMGDEQATIEMAPETLEALERLRVQGLTPDEAIRTVLKAGAQRVRAVAHAEPKLVDPAARQRIAEFARELSGYATIGRSDREKMRQFADRLEHEPDWQPTGEQLAELVESSASPEMTPELLDKIERFARDMRDPTVGVPRTEKPEYNEFAIAEPIDTVPTHCFVCLGELPEAIDGRADLLWRTSDQPIEHRGRAGQLHNECADKFLTMSVDEQSDILLERFRQAKRAQDEQNVDAVYVGHASAPAETLQPGDVVRTLEGVELGTVAGPTDVVRMDEEHIINQVRFGDQDLRLIVSPEQAVRYIRGAMVRSKNGAVIVGRQAFMHLDDLAQGGSEVANEIVQVYPAIGVCDFCRGGAPVWEYPADTFTMRDGPGQQPYTSQGNWAACKPCAALIEHHDVAGLVRRSLRGRPRDAHQSLAYYYDRLYREFEQHRSGDRVPRSQQVDANLSRTFAAAFEQSHDKPSSAEAVCDFDRSQPVVWSYPAQSFDFWPEGADKPWHSEGDWAACNSCSRAVERGDWDELVKRHTHMREEQLIHLPSHERVPVERWLRLQAQLMFQHFAKHRTGPREPVFPEANVKLPTSSPLAQVAFGEQLKLLRYVQTPEARRAIDSWVRRTRSPIKLDQLTAAQREAFVQYSVVALRYGETFYWAGDICRLIAGASDVLGKDTPWVLLREAIPAASGFFYCDRPIPAGPSAAIRAIAWTVTHSDGKGWEGTVRVDAHGRGNPETASGIILSYYSVNDNGALRPDGYYYWRFDDDHITAASYASELGGSANIDDYEWQRLGVFATMLAFVQQKIIVPSRPFTADRATRKQAERERPEREPILRIIELRRRERVGYTLPTEHKIVDWKWQWRVRPFWRKQWYPSLEIHQPKYVEGFWKGPTDAPIKPPTRIFVVDQ